MIPSVTRSLLFQTCLLFYSFAGLDVRSTTASRGKPPSYSKSDRFALVWPSFIHFAGQIARIQRKHRRYRCVAQGPGDLPVRPPFQVAVFQRFFGTLALLQGPTSQDVDDVSTLTDQIGSTPKSGRGVKTPIHQSYITLSILEGGS